MTWSYRATSPLTNAVWCRITASTRAVFRRACGFPRLWMLRPFSVRSVPAVAAVRSMITMRPPANGVAVRRRSGGAVAERGARAPVRRVAAPPLDADDVDPHPLPVDVHDEVVVRVLPRVHARLDE